MSNLIDIQAAIEAFEMNCYPIRYDHNSIEKGMTITGIKQVLDELPPAQPEIIRCRDCKQFRRWIDTDICFCDITESEISDDDFCSRAERRTDGTD